MKFMLGIVALGLIAAGLYAVNEVTRREDGTSILNVSGAPVLDAQVARPRRREIVRTVQAPGQIEPFLEVDISSQVVGKIIEMPVEEGDLVRAGDLLCRLDDADYQARVESHKANIAKLEAMVTLAEADLEKAERDWEQMQRLREQSATSELELANYRTALIGARATLEARKQELIEAQALLQSAEEDLRRTVINAPIAGVVSQRFAKSGEVVVTGTMNNPGTRIMVISDLSRMQVRCRVDEADAPLVAAGQPARIFLQSDTRKSVAGEVLRVGTKGTKPTGRDVVTFETLVLITGDDPRVKPGMTASTEIEVARHADAVAVPIQAVVYRKRRDVPEELLQEHDAELATDTLQKTPQAAEYLRLVFCLEDGKACPRLVATGINDPNSVEITSGLDTDDLVVTGPYRTLDQLVAATPVKVPPDLPEAPPEAPAVAETEVTTQPAADEAAATQPVAEAATSAPASDATAAEAVADQDKAEPPAPPDQAQAATGSGG
jgi:HlyD family secretion protein